jgi:hypothetical protein
MVTVSIVSYPPESAKEIGKRFFELTPLPDFINVVGPYTITELGEGIQAITIYKYDKSKAGEANEAIANSHMVFYGVPGYTYSLKLASSAVTSAKMMGFVE